MRAVSFDPLRPASGLVFIATVTDEARLVDDDQRQRPGIVGDRRSSRRS